MSKRNNRSIIRHTLGSGGYPTSIISASFSVALWAKLSGGRGMFSNGTLGSHASCISDSMLRLGFLYNLCRWTKLFNASCHVWIFGNKMHEMSNMHIVEIFINLDQLAFDLKTMPGKTVYGNLRRDCSHLSWRSWTFQTGLTKIYPYCTNNYICLRLAFLPHKIQKTAKRFMFFQCHWQKVGSNFNVNYGLSTHT